MIRGELEGGERLLLDVALAARVVLRVAQHLVGPLVEEEEVLRVLVARARQVEVLVRDGLVELRLQVRARVERGDVVGVGRVAPRRGEAEGCLLYTSPSPRDS